MGARKTLIAVVLIGALALVGFAVFLALQGLETADRWASVVGVFVGLVGLALSLWGLRQSSPLPPRYTPTGSTYVFRTTGDVHIAGRDVRIRKSTSIGVGPSRALLLAVGAGQFLLLVALTLVADL